MMKPILRPSVILSTLFIAVVATSEFWTDAFGFKWWFPLVVGASAATANIVVLVYSESLKLERQKFFLDRFFEAPFEQLKSIDPSVRINVMTVGWVLNKWIPKRGLRFFRCFGFNEEDPDRSLTLLIGQGVAGMAAKHIIPAIGERSENRLTLGNGHSYNAMDLNMDDRQRIACQNLEVVCSYPVRRLRQRGVETFDSGPVVAVVSIDSENKPDVREINSRFEELRKSKLRDLAKATAYILG